jgi:hypothetical protein
VEAAGSQHGAAGHMKAQTEYSAVDQR